MMRMAGVTCLAWATAAAAALAQAPPGPPQPPPPELGRWWKDTEIVNRLGLDASQTKRIEQAFYDHRLRLIDLRADLERQEAKLQMLMEADQPEEAKVGPQIDLVLGARGKLEKENAMMMLAIRRVLTVEQWRDLERIRQERERPPRPPRPGQPPMPAVPPRQPPPPGDGALQ